MSLLLNEFPILVMDHDTRPLLLLVDDVPANLHVLVSILQADYRLKTATSGVQALEIAARKDTPDLILLDVMMPGMDGHQVLQQLRQALVTRYVPVIFLTADTSDETEVLGLEEGVDDYIVKPVVAPVLRARVRSHLQRRRLERQLQLSDQVLKNTLEGIVITDAETRIVDVNPAYCRMMGYAREEIIGTDPGLFASGRHGHDFYQDMWNALAATGRWVGEVWDRRKDGTEFPKWLSISAITDAGGQLTHYVGVFSDISVLKTAEENLQRLAFYDALTELPNRTLFRDRVEQELAVSHRNNLCFALIFLDLDRFKAVNDTLGHEAGDELLRLVARRLRGCIRESDTVARQGGDEFMGLLRDLRQQEDAAKVAANIVDALQRPFEVHGHAVSIGSSIGLALYPEHGRDFETLVRHADAAMYRAKQAGRGTYRFFTVGEAGVGR